MNEYINFKSSNNLRMKYSGKTFNFVETENLKEKTSLVNFISSKDKIVLKSCFDHKGEKNFYLIKERPWIKLF